jgi:hypothetical protein
MDVFNTIRQHLKSSAIHALLLLMLEAVTTDLVFTIRHMLETGMATLAIAVRGWRLDQFVNKRPTLALTHFWCSCLRGADDAC